MSCSVWSRGDRRSPGSGASDPARDLHELRAAAHASRPCPHRPARVPPGPPAPSTVSGAQPRRRFLSPRATQLLTLREGRRQRLLVEQVLAGVQHRQTDRGDGPTVVVEDVEHDLRRTSQQLVDTHCFQAELRGHGLNDIRLGVGDADDAASCALRRRCSDTREDVAGADDADLDDHGKAAPAPDAAVRFPRRTAIRARRHVPKRVAAPVRRVAFGVDREPLERSRPAITQRWRPSARSATPWRGCSAGWSRTRATRSCSSPSTAFAAAIGGVANAYSRHVHRQRRRTPGEACAFLTTPSRKFIVGDPGSPSLPAVHRWSVTARCSDLLVIPPSSITAIRVASVIASVWSCGG